jgi:2-dehydro-3-deoxy-D-arabinonate dehydratase
MQLDTLTLPRLQALLRVAAAGRPVLALWEDGGRLSSLPGLSLDVLCALPADLARSAIERSVGPPLDPGQVELLAPADSQEVWAAGVTYIRSREARMEEAAQKDVYAMVYEAERPEIFFKAAGWRVVPSGGEAGIRADSRWDVPEPELALLTNSRGEVLGYSCGNDMSSRSIEGENPLYLPQAKVYHRSCSIGPGIVLAWHCDVSDIQLAMRIERAGETIFSGSARTSQLVRSPAAMAAVLHSSYPLPAGAWLMTGTGIVPDSPYTAEAGDIVEITIEGLGTLVNRLVRIPHSEATAPPRHRDPRLRSA